MCVCACVWMEVCVWCVCVCVCEGGGHVCMCAVQFPINSSNVKWDTLSSKIPRCSYQILSTHVPAHHSYTQERWPSLGTIYYISYCSLYTKHIHAHVPGKSYETKKVHVYNETRVPLGKMTFNKTWMARQEPTQHYPLPAP